MLNGRRASVRLLGNQKLFAMKRLKNLVSIVFYRINNYLKISLLILMANNVYAQQATNALKRAYSTSVADSTQLLKPFDPTTHKPQYLPKGMLCNVKGAKHWCFDLSQVTQLLRIDYDLGSYKLQTEVLSKNFDEQKLLIENNNKATKEYQAIIELDKSENKLLNENIESLQEQLVIEKEKPKLVLGHAFHLGVELVLACVVAGLIAAH